MSVAATAPCGGRPLAAIYMANPQAANSCSLLVVQEILAGWRDHGRPKNVQSVSGWISLRFWSCMSAP